MITFTRLPLKRRHLTRWRLITLVGPGLGAVGILLAACSSTSSPTPSGDASTAPDGGDGGVKVGCKTGFPRAGDRCTQGESCTEEGECEPDASLTRFGCGSSNTLIEVGRFACPSR